MVMESLKNKLLALGYVAKGYGYVLQLGEYFHWVTLFEAGGAQAYGYWADVENENDYTTGVLNDINEDAFIGMLEMFHINYQ